MAPMELIDVALTREQFDAFEPEVVAQLCAATQADLREWRDRLRVAWDTADQTGAARARHALHGVCGNYGAEVLIALIDDPVPEPDADERLSACVEATIAAIWAVAGVRRTD